MTKIIAIAAVAGIAAAANGQIIASQDFNALDSSNTFTADAFAMGSFNNLLTNGSSSNVGGPGIDFQTFWSDTRGNSGPLDGSESGDFIGANSFTGFAAPAVAADGTAVADGVEQNFQFNDGDGRLDLVFETVDTSGFTQRELSFNYWINDTSYESDDFFAVSINGSTVVNWGELELEANVSADDGTANWGTFTFDLEALGVASLVDLVIIVDTNASAENIFVDNIVFSNIPAPAVASVLGLGVVAGRRRRA
ncbi:MAG: hypothetical protein AAGB51_00030 [Planctomycetota bacterium]